MSDRRTSRSKFVVKIVFHDENGDTPIREDYYETFTGAQNLKKLADYAYDQLFGGGQTKVTTEIVEL